MLTPKEILSAINDQCGSIQIQYSTESGLGNGGFAFKFISERAKIGEYSLYMRVDGNYVNPVGPFKKKVNCFIELSAEPYDFHTNPYSKGSYRYACSHYESFWGKYYTADAGKMFEELLDNMISYFRECDKSTIIKTSDDNITHYVKESYEYDKYDCRSVVKHF